MSNFKINKGFISQKIGHKLSIFDGDESLLYTFNETASFIFAKIKLGWNAAKIISSLAKKYHIDEMRAKKDTTQLIKELKQKKIIS
jgi:hypothetical protein